MRTNNIVLEKSYLLALRTVQVIGQTNLSKGSYRFLFHQLMKSATSVGANVSEGVNGESKRDFIHKMFIAQKECAETIYWLRLIKDLELLDTPTLARLHKLASEILRILKSIILTSKKSLN